MRPNKVKAVTILSLVGSEVPLERYSRQGTVLWIGLQRSVRQDTANYSQQRAARTNSISRVVLRPRLHLRWRNKAVALDIYRS